MLTVTLAEVAVKPKSSVATAFTMWAPVVEVQVVENGEALSTPIETLSTKNSTCATDPSTSAAVAVNVKTSPATALAAEEATEIVGAWLLATEILTVEEVVASPSLSVETAVIVCAPAVAV